MTIPCTGRALRRDVDVLPLTRPHRMLAPGGPARPPLVLIANDQEWAARSLETLLGPNGYAVLRAYNGRQAVEMARSVQPDVVIVDLRLPDTDGLEGCRALRAQMVAATPIIVTPSDPSSRAQHVAALRAGAWDFCVQ